MAYPERHLYIGATDYVGWADKPTLDNATMVAAQGVVEQYSLTLQNYADAGGVLPSLPLGHVPVIYILRYSATLDDYDVLASGVLQVVDGSDASMQGATHIMVATPTKPLKMKLHSVVFYPQEGYEPTDTDRIRKLGVVVEQQLPDWDFTTYVDATGNITYPLPIEPNPQDGTSGERWTEYKEASVEEVIRNIATDPGWYLDPAYPVQARNWWVSGDFVTRGVPASGVKWYIHYQNVPDPEAGTITDLMDVPDPTIPEPQGVYFSGATHTADYTTVVRQINIAGARLDPHPIHWYDKAVPYHVNQGPGHVFKKEGEEGVWDTGAVSHPLPNGEWEITCQLQELYLEHDVFQRDDNMRMTKTNQGNIWLNITRDFPLQIKHQLCRATYDHGLHFEKINCYASSCILRTHLAENVEGMALAFRIVDFYNHWYVMRTGGGYGLYKVVGGAPTNMGFFGGNTSDMAEIKVSLINNDAINQIQVFIDNEFQLQVDDATHWDTTYHGLRVDCDISGGGGAFYDFQCTNLWGDRGFGLGDADGTPEKPLYDWIHMSFGFVFNSNGTLNIVQSGVIIPNTSWLPDVQDENDYHYNDRFKIGTAEYTDHATGAKHRLVQWLKQEGGQGAWLLLYEVRPVTVPIMTDASPWYAQFVAKEKGAALANTMIGKMYSNLFVAPLTHTPLYGGNRCYPANGELQSSQLDTYEKRRRVADAIFLAEAEAKVTFQAESMTRVERGAFARITSRRAGWVAGPPDTRRVLMCTSLQRVETGAKAARYRMRFGSHVYSNADPGRTHLLRPGERIKWPDAKERPFFNGMSLQWDLHVISGLEQYGRTVEVQVIPQDVLDWQNMAWPSYFFDTSASSPTLPASMFPPNGKFLTRMRTHSEDGASEWSEAVPFISPPQPPSQRPSTLALYIGDGKTALTTTGPGAYSEEMMINQSYHLVAWAVSLGTFPGNVTVDIQHCTIEERRANGEAAWVSIVNTGIKPFVTTTTNDGTFNDGRNLDEYNARALDLRQGDLIRAKLVSLSALSAKLVTLMLVFQPNAVPFLQENAQVLGETMPAAPMLDTDGEVLIDSDDEVLVEP